MATNLSEQKIHDGFRTFRTNGGAYGGELIDHPNNVVSSLRDAGLDWKVLLAPLLMDMSVEHKILVDEETNKHNRLNYEKILPEKENAWEDDPEHEPNIPVPGYYATYRDDTKSPLGVVKGRYIPVQNMDSFSWLQNAICDDVRVETAGVIRGGKKTFVVLDFGAFYVEGDEIRKHLVVMNSHDGTTNLVFQLVPFCVNTQTMLGWSDSEQKDSSYRIRHTANSRLELKEIRRILEITAFGFSRMESILISLANTSLSEKAVAKILDFTLGVTSADRLTESMRESTKISPRWINTISTIEGILEHGPDKDKSPTLYKLFKATCSYYDFFRIARGEDNDESVKFESKICGHDAKNKIEVLDKYCVLLQDMKAVKGDESKWMRDIP